MLLHARKSKCTFASDALGAILFSAGFAVVIRFAGRVIVQLSGVRSLHELCWGCMDLMRYTEMWLCGVYGYLYEPARDLQRLAISPVALWILLAVLSVFDLFCF